MPTEQPAVKSPALKRLLARRRSRRDELWADAADVTYAPALTGGYTRMSRVVPMIASLIDQLGGKSNAGRLYVVLWAHEFGDGYVEVADPAQLALEAGYITGRAERSFAERVDVLRGLGFIRTAPHGLRAHGFVLLIDPHRVAWSLHHASPTRVPAAWWSAFTVRCQAVGISLGVPAPPSNDRSEAVAPTR